KETMKTLIKMFAVTTLLLTASCSFEELTDKVIPKQESEFAQDYLLVLRDKDFDYVKKYIDPGDGNSITDAKLRQISEYFPGGELLSTKIIGLQVSLFDSKWQGKFSFEFQFTDGWALANIILRRSGDVLSVVGFNVIRTEASQKDINKFTLTGKSALQYFVLLLAVVAPLFILITTYFCIRTPIPKWKWLWVLFILVGFGSISINWTTGQFGFQPLSLKLLSASAVAAGSFAPWIISTSIPLGAILFWFKRHTYIEANRVNNAVNEDK
ncbi:MAG: hypothetical protein ACC641_09625, partial [Acidiferrobacterales bacterium]